MRVTIVFSDKLVGVDDRFIEVPNLDTLYPNPMYHAVQWDNNRGELEYIDTRPNVPLSNIDFLQPAIDAWQVLADEQDAPEPPNPNQDIIDALVELQDDGVTNQTMTIALFIKETKGSDLMLNDIETKIDASAATLGITYDQLATYLVKGVS